MFDVGWLVGGWYSSNNVAIGTKHYMPTTDLIEAHMGPYTQYYIFTVAKVLSLTIELGGPSTVPSL